MPRSLPAGFDPLTRVDFDSLDAIKAHPIFGNAHHDMALMMGIDRFCRDPRFSVTDKCAALDHMAAEVMGIDDEACDEAGLREYLEA